MKMITSSHIQMCPHWSQWVTPSIAMQQTVRRALDDSDWDTIWTYFEPVVGIETHIGLKSEHKLFSGAFKGHAGWLDMGYPGALPQLDPVAVEAAILLGKSVHARIPETMFFERKRYAYPDLSKGYQTTQKTSPVWSGGALECSWGSLPLTRAQLEEDAASVIRSADGFVMDFVRAGAPLLEVVSEAIAMTKDQLVDAIRTLYFQSVLLGVSDGKIEEGQLKSDINLSIRPRGSDFYSERWEIKGVGSFQFAGMAFEDAMRQRLTLLLDESKSLDERLGKACTLGFSEDKGFCYLMRQKLSEHQYRFLPCPDLGELSVSSYDDQVVHTYAETMDWLSETLKEARYDQRWTTALEQRIVLRWLGKRLPQEVVSGDRLWLAVVWLSTHPESSLDDLWKSLRQSKSVDEFKVALRVLEEGPWDEKKFSELLFAREASQKDWEHISMKLAEALAMFMTCDPKFKAARQELLAGKLKAKGYLQGALMRWLKETGAAPIDGALLSSWIDKHVETMKKDES